MKKLQRHQWEQLACQMERTPDPDESFSASGEHYNLTALLNSFGYNPRSRKASWRLGCKLWEAGYR